MLKFLSKVVVVAEEENQQVWLQTMMMEFSVYLLTGISKNYPNVKDTSGGVVECGNLTEDRNPVSQPT